MANFLMLVADEEKEITNTCGLSASEALALTRPLHALIDEEKKKKSSLSFNEERQIMSKKEMIARVKETQSWFCKSKLLLKLKSELEPNGLNAL